VNRVSAVLVRDGARRLCAAAVFLWLPLALFVTSNSARSAAQVSIPSNVAWTQATLEVASSGDPFRGLLLARRCDHCHGSEGFSSNPTIPNLAAMDNLTIWKQLDDFRSDTRTSLEMRAIASELSSQDSADLAAYYSMLPISPDPEDKRAFPQASPGPAEAAVAARLVTLGDGQRGIPPCQACHGPVGYVRGAPSLATQNGAYIRSQLEGFAGGLRTNDINMPMRSIAKRLKEEERQALADYYGAGLGMLPAGATQPK